MPKDFKVWVSFDQISVPMSAFSLQVLCYNKLCKMKITARNRMFVNCACFYIADLL